jgi:glutamate:GABA antiporter
MAEVELKQEKAKLVKTLHRWDLVFFSVCALIGLDAVASLANIGLGQGITWLLAFVIIFLLPYGLLMAEVGAAFPAEGGIYTWVRMAYGRLPGEITAILYWISNAVWIGGSLSAVTIASVNSFFLEPNGKADIGTTGSIIIGLIFVWVTIALAVIALKYGKWAGNIGATVKALAVILFAILVIASLAKHGLPAGHAAASTFKPTISGFLGVIGLIVFLFVGFELESGASEEMTNPQRDVPVGVLRSGIITAVLYAIVVGGILLALPVKEITNASGLTGAFATVNKTVVGTSGGAHALGYLFGIIIILTLLGSSSVWVLGSARVQAVAALDGAAPRVMGRFGKQGTPVVMAYITGVIGSIFVILVFTVANGSLSNFFAVMMSLAVSTAVLCYLFAFPAVITLRKKYPDVHRPFVVPGGTAGLWICAVVAEISIVLTGFTLLWPGLIDNILGQKYDIVANWDVSRTFFESVTLGTFVVIILISIGLWAWGRAETKGAETTAEDLIEGAVIEEA